MKSLLFFLLLSGLATAGLLHAGSRYGRDGDCPKEERKRLQGTWKVVRAVNNGEDVPMEDLEEIVLIFDGDTIEVREGERVNDHYRFRLHLEHRPRGIDFHYTEGKKKGRVDRAIYHIEGHTLRICTQENPSGDRPRDFSASKGSERSLVVLKRKAK